MKNSSMNWKKLHDWWTTPLAQSFITAESIIVKRMMLKLFGYHLLLLGEAAFIQCVMESPIIHRVWIRPNVCFQECCVALSARHDKLPIISDGIDLVYLAHCLEFITNPHEVLRETFRVLIPEGHVIISAFNPWSLWGLWKYLVRFIKRVPWDVQFISSARLKDWLALLGFDVIEVYPYFFRPPIARPGVLKRLEWLERLGKWCWPFWGGGYVLLARKRIITLTPIRPEFKIQDKILTTGIIEPVRSE